MRTKGTSCSDGSKFVLKAGGGVRKQFLFTTGKIILAFVTNGEQFASCSSFTEVTSSVECKVIYIFVKLNRINQQTKPAREII